MLRASDLSSFAVLLFLACHLAGPASAAQGDIFSTSKTNVNVRSGPSTNADILTRINPGDQVVEVDTRGDWRLVRQPDGKLMGWIFSRLLDQFLSASDQGFGLPTETARPSNDPILRAARFEEGPIGDAKKGEEVFYKCGACHTIVEGVHAGGPSLVGVFGRSPAEADGFRYSGAMQAFAREGAVWDEVTLDRFIQRPARVVKGTSMPFSGVRDPEDRRNLIAYLQRLSN